MKRQVFLIAISALLPYVTLADAQYQSSAGSPPASITTEFHSAYINAQSNFYAVSGYHSEKPGEETAQTSITELEQAAVSLKNFHAKTEVLWANASDAQKGNLAGASIAAERFILGYVAAIGARLQCSIPNKTASTPNYYAESMDLRSLENHVDDAADAVIAAKTCIPADQQQSTASKIAHSKAVGITTGLHTEFWGKGKRDAAHSQDQLLAKYAGQILAPAQALMQFLPAESTNDSSDAKAAAITASTSTPEPAKSVSAGGDFPAGPHLPVLHTSRQPDEGCHWEPFVSTDIKVALLVEKCVGKDSYRSADTTNLIGRYRKGANSEILIFAKPAEQSLDDAIRQQVGPSLPAHSRAACHAVLAKEQSTTPSWQSYDFTAATGTFRNTYKNADFTTTLPCAPWEQMDTAVKFLYRPSESKTTFLFVNFGQETPPWDIDSLRFLPVAETK